MKTSSIVVTGALETEAALTEFGTVKVPREMRRAIVSGAKIMRAAIKDQSSFAGQGRENPGALLRSIKYKSTSAGGHLLTVTVGPQGKNSHARHLVILGHNVQRVQGGPILGRTRPNDFVARGEDASADKAQEAITAAFALAIETAGKP